MALIEPVRHPGPSVGPVRHLVGRAWLKLFGWKVDTVYPEAKRGVFVASPHTSYWDLPFTLAVAWSMRMNLNWVGKKELFRFPFGGFMRALGGVSVDRSQRTDFVKQTADAMKSAPEGMFIVIAPSGTRSKRDHWKSGFYHLARAADAPLLIAYLDYGRKRGGVGMLEDATDDVRGLMTRVREFYRDVEGRHPAQTSTPRLREEDAAQDVTQAA